MSRTTLDHIPIVLEMNRPFWGPFPFKFEEMWFIKRDFMEVVKEWNQVVYDGNPSRNFALKLKALKWWLKEWNRYTGSSLKANMEVCQKRFIELDLVEEERNLSYEERGEREAQKREFLMLALKEETFWIQHSKITWLKEGDQSIIFSITWPLITKVLRGFLTCRLMGDGCKIRGKSRERWKTSI